MVPSGHVERGESLTDAVMREVMEEVGIGIERENLRLVHTMYRPAHDATGERADFFFEARAWRGEPRNREPEKCDEVAWFPLNALPENIVGYLRVALAAVERGDPLSEPGWRAR
jgi:ADP-ribose pyrophosphatase YjhB (NUDIX family)